MKVLELMKTHVVRTTPDATLGEAVDLMDLYQTNGLPVVDAQECLCGILTEYDVLRALSNLLQHSPVSMMQTEAESALFIEKTLIEKMLKSRDAEMLLVGSYMTHPAISITEHTDLRSAALLMLQHHLKRLPVTTEAGQVVGVLNRIDIFQGVFADDF